MDQAKWKHGSIVDFLVKMQTSVSRMETLTKELCVLTDYSAVIVVAADAFPARVLPEIARGFFAKKYLSWLALQKMQKH